jgi:hypothetical protein
VREFPGDSFSRAVRAARRLSTLPAGTTLQSARLLHQPNTQPTIQPPEPTPQVWSDAPLSRVIGSYMTVTGTDPGAVQLLSCWGDHVDEAMQVGRGGEGRGASPTQPAMALAAKSSQPPATPNRPPTHPHPSRAAPSCQNAKTTP